MTAKTVEIFVFWVAETQGNPNPAQMYALPLTSTLPKKHPIMKCLRTANFIIVDEETPLPDKRPCEFCTFLVYEDPAVRQSRKIPVVYSGFCSRLAVEKLQEDKILLTQGRNTDRSCINMIDAQAIRIIARLLTPGRHLYRVTAKDKWYNLPRLDSLLNFAIDRKCFMLCEIILESKVDVNDCSALERAIKTGSVRMVQLLLDNGADAAGQGDVLFHAAQTGDLGLTKVLLEHGAQINGVYSLLKRTALHEARKSDMARLLLDSGASVDAKNRQNRTPLHEAVWRQDAGVVRILLENNADIGATFEVAVGRRTCRRASYLTAQSNAVAEAVCLDKSTIFDMLVKFGGTAKAGDLQYLNASEDSSVKNLLEKVERYFDLVFEDFKETTMSNQELSRSLQFLSVRAGRRGYYKPEYIHKVEGTLQKLSSFIIKVEVAYGSRGPRIPENMWREFKLTEFKERCENEVKIMKQRNVSGTSRSFHEILTGDPCLASRLFRDVAVASALKNDSLFADFPIYRSVLERRVSRASWRRQVVNDGLKLLAYLLPQFTSLPWSIRETIVDLLTNQEILIVEACFSRKQLKTIVGIPNCQTLLDAL